MTFQEAPGDDVQNYEHVDALKGDGHDHKEVAGQHGASMVAKKRRPGLRRLTAAAERRPTRHIAANRARRPGETELQSELRRDPPLTLDS